MCEVHLNDALGARLNYLAAQAGKGVDEYANDLLRELIEDREDYLLAHAIAQKNERTYSAEEVRRELGLGG